MAKSRKQAKKKETRGRPSLPAELKRTKKVTVTYTEDEYDRLQKKATSEPAIFIREASLA